MSLLNEVVDRAAERYSVAAKQYGQNNIRRIRLSDDEASRIMVFVGEELVLDPSLTPVDLAFDYEMHGTDKAWNAFLQGDIDLMSAIGTPDSEFSVRGDMAKFGSDAEVLFDMFDFRNRVCADTDETWETSAEVTGHYVNVKGIRTYYERTGSPDLPVLLTLHTAGRDNRQWQQLGDRLADEWQTIALDLPGHGKSWPAGEQRCLRTGEEIAEFIAAFWEAANLATPLVVAGCSMGGNMVYQLASKYQKEVRGIISMQGADHSDIQSIAGLKWMDHPQINVKTFFRPRTHSLAGRNVSKMRQDYLLWESEAYDSTSIESDMHSYITGDYRELTPSITCPILIIDGQDDRIVTQGMVESTISRISDSVDLTVERPEGVGHFAHVEQPDLIAGLVG